MTQGAWKLTAEKVATIRGVLLAVPTINRSKLAKAFNVTRESIYRIEVAESWPKVQPATVSDAQREYFKKVCGFGPSRETVAYIKGVFAANPNVNARALARFCDVSIGTVYHIKGGYTHRGVRPKRVSLLETSIFVQKGPQSWRKKC